MQNDTDNIEKLLMSVHDLQKECGFSRSMSYQLLNRSDLPVIKIGDRRFMHRTKFLAWLDAQADRAE
jgi:hypothetical protein